MDSVCKVVGLVGKMLFSGRPYHDMGAPSLPAVPAQPARHFPQWSRTAILTLASVDDDGTHEVGALELTIIINLLLYFLCIRSYIYNLEFVRKENTNNSAEDFK